MNIFDDQRVDGGGVFAPQRYAVAAPVRVFADQRANQRAGGNPVFGDQMLAPIDPDERKHA